jgi:hypothetical protein
MAEDLNRAVAGRPALPPAEAEPLRREGTQARRGSVFLGRFRLVYALLAVLLGAAVGGFVVLSRGGVDVSGDRWSSWEPEGTPPERASEIARFVPRRYRLESGKQLVVVSVEHPPRVQEVPVKYVAVAAGDREQDIDLLSTDDTVAYVLCGLGENCAIREGKPTVERAALLRREALELALYTFKYVQDVGSVVAFLPPSPGKRPRYALFFQEDDLGAALDRPLQRTLAPRGINTPSSLEPGEATVIRRYVDRHLFQYSFGQAADGSVYLALRPLPL